MFRKRCSASVLPMFAAVWLGLIASPLVAQPGPGEQERVPDEVMRADPITQADRNKLAPFFEKYVDQLLNGTDAEVVKARTRLINPLNALIASDSFKSNYSQMLAERIDPALDSDRIIVQFNAMIIAGRLEHSAVVGLIEKAFSSASPAVRYGAAKAVTEVVSGTSDVLTDAQKRGILALLSDQIGKEQSAPVLEKCLEALSELDIPEADQKALEALDNRVNFHVKAAAGWVLPQRNATRMAAETAILNNLYRKMITDQAEGANVTQTARELARVVRKYMYVAGRQLEATAKANVDISSDLREDRIEMIRAADIILQFVAENVFEIPNNRRPERLRDALAINDWSTVVIRSDQWRRVLERDLDVPQSQNDVPAPPARQAAQP
ncbi:MAG: hypothetical protein MI741_07995 [Rhodospirillales bacterium]|nr:hypothetical protein [Rhodospirillales bacterium]